MAALPRTLGALVLLACALSLAERGETRAQPITAIVDTAESVIDYTGVAPMHDGTGTSRDVTGWFVLNPSHPDPHARGAHRLRHPAQDQSSDIEISCTGATW